MRGENDNRCESGVFADVAERETDIAKKHLDVVAGSHVADTFFDLLDAAGFDLRFAARLVGREPVGTIFVGEEIGVGAEFGVEIGFGAFAAEKIAAEAGETREKAHDDTPSNSKLVGFECAGDGEGDAGPAFGFGVELAAAGGGEFVEFGAPIVFGFAPACGEPALLFHAMKGGKEGAGFDVESAFGDLADAAGDAEAV